MHIEQHEVSVGPQRVHYLTAGSGPPLLLLHAVGESSATWREVLPALAARSRVYAPDLPGFGGSAPPARQSQDDELSPARLAAAMAGFLTAVTDAGSGPVTVLGNSFGGSVGIELALRHPERVGQLVLEDSAGLGRYVHPALSALTVPGFGDVLARLARTRPGAAHRAWLRVPLMFARPELAPPHWIDEHRRLATVPHHLPTTLAALRAQVSPLGQRRVLLDALPQIRVPTLLVWGDRDAVLPLSQARAAVQRLQHGRLVVVPRCGHLPHLERPQHFIEALDAFLG